MASNNRLKYEITADATKFEKVMQKTLQTSKTVSKGIGVAVGAGAVAGAAALAGMTKVMSEAVELANIQEDAEAKLGAVLRATGEAAGFNKDQMVAMAGALQSVTTIGDETIIAGQAILATFKEIKGDAFDAATKAALDMSAVMGQDLKSSITQVGKALNDPIRGMTALSRVGVSFTKEQKEQIKTLQESGDILGAQKIILEELQSEFGGAAEALRNTFGGATIAAKNAFGDLQEQIGYTITKNEFFIESAKLAERTFISWTDNIKDNKEQFNELAKTIGLGLFDAMSNTLKVVGFFHVGWLELKTVVPVVVDAFAFGVEAIYNMLRNLMTPLDLIFSGIEKVAGFLGKDFTNPFDAIQSNIAEFGDMTQYVMEQSFQDVADAKEGWDALGKKLDELRGKMENYSSSSPEKEYVDSWRNVKTVIDEVGESTDDFTKKQLTEFAKLGKGIEDTWLDFNEGKKDADDTYLEESLELHNQFFEDLKQSRETDTETAIRELDEWIDQFKALPEDLRPSAEELAELYQSKLEDITEANKDATDTMAEAWNTLGDNIGDAVYDVLDTEFNDLSESWDDFCDSMESSFNRAVSNVVSDYMESGIKSMFEDDGGDSGGSLWDSISSIWENWNTGGYLSPYGTKYYSNGGGILQGGSGVRDDIYLGKVNGTNIMAQGGEFIVNPMATSQNLGLLKDINDGKVKGYATGGNVGEYMSDLVKTNNSYLLGALHFMINPQSYMVGLVLEMIVDAIKWGWNELTDNQSITQSFVDAMESYSLIDEDSLTSFADSISADLDGMATSVDIDGLSSSITDGLSSFESTATSIGDSLASNLSTIDASLASWAESDRQLAASMQATVATVLSSVAATVYAPQNTEAGLYGSMFPSNKENYWSLYADGSDRDRSGDKVGGLDDSAGQDTNPGEDGYTGGVMAKGGIISSSDLDIPDGWSVPPGEDGFLAVQAGEGVIDADTMQILSKKIRNGEFGGGNITVKVYLNDKELKTTIDDVIVSRNRRGANPTGRAYI